MQVELNIVMMMMTMYAGYDAGYNAYDDYDEGYDAGYNAGYDDYNDASMMLRMGHLMAALMEGSRSGTAQHIKQSESGSGRGAVGTGWALMERKAVTILH